MTNAIINYVLENNTVPGRSNNSRYIRRCWMRLFAKWMREFVRRHGCLSICMARLKIPLKILTYWLKILSINTSPQPSEQSIVIASVK
jgi:hypothetical protein